MRYSVVPVVGILVLAWLPGLVGAQNFPVGPGLSSLGLPSVDSSSGRGAFSLADAQDPAYFGSIGARKYINSFTAYQFPSAIYPQLDPLSRLEWPWEQVVGVIKVGYLSPVWDIKLAYASTLLLPSGLKAQDSDWTFPNDPNQKTIFSEGKAKPRISTFDASLAGAPILAPLLKGVIGLRIQQFNFTYTDATQWSLIPQYNTGFTPGPGIEFSQHYYQWYGGGIVTFVIDVGALYGPLSPARLVFRFQGDYGYDKGTGMDFHILGVPGPRITYENTTGHSWHVNATIGLVITSTVALSVEGDFIRVRTAGSHHWTEPGTNWSWDGAKVWSDQSYVEVNGAIAF